MSSKTGRLGLACRLALPVAAAAALTSCAVPLKAPVAGYTCCNLREYNGWISSNNVQGGTLVPAGESIALTTMKRDYYAYGQVGSREIGLRDDQAKQRADTLAWLDRVVVKENPSSRIASWPPEVRNAVAAGRVIRGMTREQVLVALGHPARSDTPDLAAPDWRYWTAFDDSTVDIHFDDAGKVARLSGKPSAVRAVQADL